LIANSMKSRSQRLNFSAALFGKSTKFATDQSTFN
jgi:hypothetical protein